MRVTFSFLFTEYLPKHPKSNYVHSHLPPARRVEERILSPVVSASNFPVEAAEAEPNFPVEVAEAEPNFPVVVGESNFPVEVAEAEPNFQSNFQSNFPKGM